MGKELLKVTKKLGIEFYLGHKVTAVQNRGEDVLIKAESKDGKGIELTADYCLVSIGRRPYTEGLGLDKIGIPLEKGQVRRYAWKTSAIIFMPGDVAPCPMLGISREEGVAGAEVFSGQSLHSLLLIRFVYTWPSGERRLPKQLKKSTNYKVQISYKG